MAHLCIIHSPSAGHLYSKYFTITIGNRINISPHISLPLSPIIALILKLLKLEFPSQRDFKALYTYSRKWLTIPSFTSTVYDEIQLLI